MKMLNQKDKKAIHWHPSARLWTDAGFLNMGDPNAPVKDVAVFSDCDSVRALAGIFSKSTAAHGFCIAPNPPSARAITPSSATQPWLCTLTSGSSGTQRIVRRSQASWLASIVRNQRRFKITTHDCYAVLGRLGHSLSLYASIEALALGASLRLLSDTHSGTQALRLTESDVTILYATPAQLRLMLLSPIPQPRLRLIMIGGSKLDDKTRLALRRIAPNADIREFYGASETGFITVTDKDTPQGSVGQAYPGVTLEIRSPDGRQVPAGETGEIWVSSPYLFQGYTSGAAPNTRWSGRFLSVGEYGALDENGYLYLHGRKGRMVTIADQNVFPEEVETCLLGIQGVVSAAVLPQSDTLRGHILVAFIEGAEGIPDHVIQEQCRAKLGALKTPRRIVRPTNWPRLPSGKPDIQALGRKLVNI